MPVPVLVPIPVPVPVAALGARGPGAVLQCGTLRRQPRGCGNSGARAGTAQRGGSSVNVTAPLKATPARRVPPGTGGVPSRSPAPAPQRGSGGRSPALTVCPVPARGNAPELPEPPPVPPPVPPVPPPEPPPVPPRNLPGTAGASPGTAGAAPRRGRHRELGPALPRCRLLAKVTEPRPVSPGAPRYCRDPRAGPRAAGSGKSPPRARQGRLCPPSTSLGTHPKIPVPPPKAHTHPTLSPPEPPAHPRAPRHPQGLPAQSPPAPQKGSGGSAGPAPVSPPGTGGSERSSAPWFGEQSCAPRRCAQP
ncbi:PREDICTED: basic proline-rich protein-like [Sturnus vulgaris]|uniref:basic proline-rich protein-like n=1 Tax=Sturnus vulgaris TaxID=9172 RepID=UPI00071AA585|nr:PREDICTED: basic proline-rich protein-like [Sturnus vulgaris]